MDSYMSGGNNTAGGKATNEELVFSVSRRVYKAQSIIKFSGDDEMKATEAFISFVATAFMQAGQPQALGFNERLKQTTAL